MNTDMIRRVADAIEGRTIPWLGFNMGFFVLDSSEVDDREELSRIFPDHTGRHCGTVACIAGWTVILGRRLTRAPAEEDFAEAQRMLGLSDEQAEDLFYGWGSDCPTLGTISDAQAIRTLRHLAETGVVDWNIA